MAKSSKSAKPESIHGYFRPIFKENPKLLKQRSNEALYERWLKNHPGEEEAPEKVKQGLSNLKSALRAKLRRQGRKPREEQSSRLATRIDLPDVFSLTVKKWVRGAHRLDILEAQIDEALLLAKQLDPAGLDDVIWLPRAARNRVIVQIEGV